MSQSFMTGVRVCVMAFALAMLPQIGHASDDTLTLDFIFTLTKPTCNLSTQSPSIVLDTLAASDFASVAAGTIAHPKPVTLSVRDCVYATTATFTFQANPDATAPALFATTGPATGVGIDLRTTADNLPIRADGTQNTRSATILPNGTASIPLQVAYARNGAPTVGPGQVHSAIIFQASYN